MTFATENDMEKQTNDETRYRINARESDEMQGKKMHKQELVM